MPRRALVAIGILGLLFAGCYAHPGAPVAERLRAADLPYVEDFKYQPMQFPSDALGDWIEIFLRADVTDAQVVDLYCNIVTPGAAAELGSPEGLAIYKGVTWHTPAPGASSQYTWFDGGTLVVAPACPG